MSKIVKLDVPKIEQRVDRHGKRTLEHTFPQLKSYLKPGLNVLDVGCGPELMCGWR